MYVANSQGLLKYNGARWELYPLPNESIVRSVKVLGDKIYTGGYREFGYWEEDPLGELEYFSLSEGIRNELLPDEEFWSILKFDQFLVFHSLDRLYTYHLEDKKLDWVDTRSSLPEVFVIGQSVLFQRPDEGLFSIENGEVNLKYDFQVFRDDEVVNIFEREEGLLVLTKRNGFFEQEGEGFRPWKAKVNEELSGVSIYAAIRLRSGGYALGTISEGLLVLDEEGQVVYRIDQKNGLQNNTVLSLFEDVAGTLWLGLDNGIGFLNLTSPYRIYQDYSGVIGSVYTTAEHQNFLYMGTNQGLYFRVQGTDAPFKMVPGTDGQVWSLNEIGGTLFCGHHNGTLIIEGATAKKIASIPGTWGVRNLPGRDGLALQGNYSGLYILEEQGDDWKVRNKIAGFDNSSRYFEVLSNEIFVNHEYKGLFRIETDDNFERALQVQVDTLRKGANSGLGKYRGDLLYAYREGIYRFDTQKDDFERDTILSSLLDTGGYVSGKLISGRGGESLWVFTEKNISFITPGMLDDRPIVRIFPIGTGKRKGINGYESVYGPDLQGNYIFGANNGYFTFDMEGSARNIYEVRLDKISVGTNKGGSWERTLIDPDKEGEFGNRQNNLEFHFYSPVYRALNRPAYQYRLQGMYDEWSEWTESSSVSFSNLPFGDYVFEVRAKAGNDLSGNTPSYSFSIARPWYLTGIAMVSYLLLLILAAIGTHRAYRRHYNARQQEIIDRNKQEMALAKARSEKEIIDLKNRQLKEEFRNKSNELAASTLSIIKKNELLSEVKEQLLSETTHDPSSKRIVQIIDRNLNRTDDWELFKEAFNNADRDFLNKLRKKHPNLSHNDIKLCAYLRLNLTSKEIAPLLNISTRSVEIKRYRLRKKMDLDHSSNLTDYILSL